MINKDKCYYINNHQLISKRADEIVAGDKIFERESQSVYIVKMIEKISLITKKDTVVTIRFFCKNGCISGFYDKDENIGIIDEQKIKRTRDITRKREHASTGK